MVGLIGAHLTASPSLVTSYLPIKLGCQATDIYSTIVLNVCYIILIVYYQMHSVAAYAWNLVLCCQANKIFVNDFTVFLCMQCGGPDADTD